ncbi:MAG: Fic family protein [Bacteroidales bacterium]|jgi:Fic family protein|nr:Fic family protein [Bacteroidales bacterium]
MTYKTNTLETINSLKLEFDSLLPMNKEDEKRYDKKLRLEFNYNSNHLEGNTLTYGQTQLLLLYDKSSGDVPVSDIEEMKAHDLALSQIEEMAKDKERPLTELFIKELNKTILVKPYWKDAITDSGISTRKKIEIGQYKTTPNSVQLKDGKIHEYSTPEETPALMNDLLSWYNNNFEKMHPVQLATEFHYKFVCIHPFDDGNGRVARLIMNYILLRNGYPPVIIKAEDKENYLSALQKADIGEISSIIEYIEEQSIWSLEIAIKAAKGEEIEEYGDIEKEIEVLKREKLTKAKIFKTPKVTYELISHINNDLWQPLNKVLLKFDDFFAETTIEKYIDNRKIEKTRTIPNAMLKNALMFADKTVTIKPYEVFGYDLEDDDISDIRWTRKLLSLKSAEKKIDFEITCNLELFESSYVLLINESNTNTDSYMMDKTLLYEKENGYKTFLMGDSIEEIIRIVSNHLIKNIKG